MGRTRHSTIRTRAEARTGPGPRPSPISYRGPAEPLTYVATSSISVISAAADVDLSSRQLVEARDEGLLQADEEIPWDHLAAVRVPGELKVHAVRIGELDALGLVREEYARARSVTTGERLDQIGPVSVAVRRRIVDAREVEAVVAADAHMLVAKHANAEVVSTTSTARPRAKRRNASAR